MAELVSTVANFMKQVSLDWSPNKQGRNALHVAAFYGSVSSMYELSNIELVGLVPAAEDKHGNTPNDYFYKWRDEFCLLPREFEAEEKAWTTLMLSACHQNGIDPTSLGFDYDVCSDFDQYTTSESSDSESEGYEDAMEDISTKIEAAEPTRGESRN